MWNSDGKLWLQFKNFVNIVNMRNDKFSDEYNNLGHCFIYFFINLYFILGNIVSRNLYSCNIHFYIFYFKSLSSWFTFSLFSLKNSYNC